jgi:TRAP-type C4-dicarboxylate transport system substrate-binding protein
MKIGVILAAGCAALLNFLPAQAETLRFSSFEPPNAFITAEILTPWAKQVSDASGGELTIQMFPGGTMGRDPAQQLQLVEHGVADIAWVIPGYTPGRFSEGTVGELPFLVKSSAAGSTAMWKMYEQGLFKGDYDKFKMLCICSSSPNFIGATRPVREPKDMKDLKMRAPGPTMLSAIGALGAVPVGGITAPTLAEALSRDLIQGTFLQWGVVESFRLGEVVPFYNEVPLGATPMLVVMNKQKYDGLSPKAKAAIDKFAGAAFSEQFGKAFDAYMTQAKARIAAKFKPEIMTPTDAQMAQWQDVVKIASQDWITKNGNGQKIYDAFSAALKASGNN